jgi:hypothetical protein
MPDWTPREAFGLAVRAGLLDFSAAIAEGLAALDQLPPGTGQEELAARLATALGNDRQFLTAYVLQSLDRLGYDLEPWELELYEWACSAWPTDENGDVTA